MMLDNGIGVFCFQSDLTRGYSRLWVCGLDRVGKGPFMDAQVESFQIPRQMDLNVSGLGFKIQSVRNQVRTCSISPKWLDQRG